MKRKWVIILGIFVFFLLSPIVQANLAINGDFESGNQSFLTDYTYSPDSTYYDGTYAIDVDPLNVHNTADSYGDHTSGSGNMMIVNGSAISDKTVWQQTVSVDSDTNYTFSFWISNWSEHSGDPAYIEVFINDLSLGTIIEPLLGGVWEKKTFSWNSESNDTATIHMVDLVTIIGGNDFALDDISFIPEPATVLLLGFGGMLIHRKK